MLSRYLAIWLALLIAFTASAGLITQSGPKLRQGSSSSSSSSSGGGSFAQGSLYTITGTGFGTRGDYNIGGYTYHGHTHLHWRWMTFPNAMPANGSSQAAFEAALDGGFPAEEFAFSNSPSTFGLTLQTGGPSQSGRYLQKVGASFADPGALEALTDSSTTVPNDGVMFMVFKHRGDGDGKIFRWWKTGQGSSGNDYYIGSSGVFREDSYWTNVIDAVAFKTFNRDLTTWRRWVVYQTRGTTGTTISIDGTLQDYEAYNGGNPILPRPSGLPCMPTTENNRGVEFNWPNSTDSGGTQQFADIFVDFTPARVEITGANGEVEIQPVHSWTDSEIVIIGNIGEMNAGTGTLRVRNASDSIIHTASVTVP